MYHLPCICRTLVPKIRVHPEMLCVFRYIGVLTCVIYNCTRLNKQQGLLVSAVKYMYIDEDYLVGECADTWYKRMQPTETV